MKELYIAIVIPWFGEDLTGGAEMLAWQVATRLAHRGHKVEVLTSCCQSFQSDWAKNHHKEGTFETNNFMIKRFKTSSRNRERFDDANAMLLSIPRYKLKPGVSPVKSEVSKIFMEHNIHTPGMYKYLEKHGKNYDAIIFMPYLYGPILKGIFLTSKNALLQPCLHDEVYAYLPEIGDVFYAANKILLNSDGEAELISKIYGPCIVSKSVVVGSGIETESVREDLSSPIKEPYILYLGRKDETKNTPFVLNMMNHYKQRYPESKIKLVFAGPGELPPSDLQSNSHILDMGLVDNKTKQSLLKHCVALVQPSVNESFSRVMMEAWHFSKPVIVHSDCLATRTAVESSQGGFIAGEPDEWVQAFYKLENLHQNDLETVGNRGQVYAKKIADWDSVISRYEDVISNMKESFNKPINKSKKKAVHQLLPNLSYGDAISNHAVTLKETLRNWGYDSNIYVRYLDDRMAHHGLVFDPQSIGDNDLIIYHHSIGSELTEFAVKHPGPKLLIYHNITPADFFKPFRPDFAGILEKGRVELKDLAGKFQHSAGDSEYNVDELKQLGFNNPEVLPIIVAPHIFKDPPDPEWMANLQDGVKNILFVGRLAPNKCQHHLLEAFKDFLTFESNARLIIVGHAEEDDPYVRFLKELTARLGIESNVVFTGQVSHSQLWACYKTAHLFWSMSEHEGFCVPLVEAMWFDVPILAYNSSAIPETLGKAGIIFTEKKWPEISALAKLITDDNKLRSSIISEQRKRRQDFLPENILPQFKELIEGILS